MLTLVVPMREGESLHLDVGGLPHDARVTAKTLRDEFLPEPSRVEGARDVSCELVATYAGWFKINLLMPPTMQGASLTLAARVES